MTLGRRSLTMKHFRTIVVLSLIIIIFAVISAGYGLFASGGAGEYSYESIRGETIQIYGKGLYAYDSVSMAAQARAQDGVTLFMGIPLLILSLIMTAKGLIKGRLLLTGTLGYFLYTYASYCFLAMYNSMFLLYIALFSVSFFAFILMMMSFDKETLTSYFKESFPAKSIATFLWFIGFMIAMLWLGKIVNPLMNGMTPEGLEHYSTLSIQAMDLAIVVPMSIVTGLMVYRKQSFGYLLAAVVIFKGVTLLTAITAMAGSMVYKGVDVSPLELAIFPTFNIGFIVCMVILLRQVREPLQSN
jgi:hypothetical protein